MIDTVCWKSCTSLSAAVSQMEKQEYPYRGDVSPVISSTFSQVILTGLSICCVFISERTAPFFFFFFKSMLFYKKCNSCSSHTVSMRLLLGVTFVTALSYIKLQGTYRCLHVYVFLDFDQNMWLCARWLIICTFWPPAQIRAHKQSIAG